MENSSALLMETLLSLFILLLAAKIGGELARRCNVAVVVGELLAGVLMAPTLLGGFMLMGSPLVVINEPVWVFAQLGAVLLLFLVGLETKFASFVRSGGIATVVACCGVIVPFFLGYGLTVAWGFPSNEALMVGAALTATSISITVKVLKDIGKIKTPESKILIGAAVIDDVLGLIVLAVVLGLVKSGSFALGDLWSQAILPIIIWLIMIVLGVFVLARVIDFLCPRPQCTVCHEIKLARTPHTPGPHCTVKCDGPQEASIIALCFGFAYIVLATGLSPILGSFAAGMSIAETKILPNIQEVIEKINFLMTPIFFVVIGAMVDLSGLTVNAAIFAVILIILAMLGKLIGCSIPVLVMRRNAKEAIIVGLGMMSRGEVGLVVAGIGVEFKVFSSEVFAAVVLMVVVTTVVTPFAMTYAYKKLKFDSAESL
jgi:Kef-type K+ transport system membrane component KefB